VSRFIAGQFKVKVWAISNDHNDSQFSSYGSDRMPLCCLGLPAKMFDDSLEFSFFGGMGIQAASAGYITAALGVALNASRQAVLFCLNL